MRGSALNENFNDYCVVASSSNYWMNEELILLYLKRVIGSFSFQKRLLNCNTSEAHMTKPVRKLLKKMRIDDAVILGECPKFSQTSDVF